MGERLNSIKRIFAWLLLLGFIALLVNIFVLHVYLRQSCAVYVTIAIAFIFLKKRTSF